jgi:glycosyltransferase involved in cell wall biosynthesis
MRILYDHQVFSFQKYGGISRYFVQIISNLPVKFEFNVSTRYSDNEYLKQLRLKQAVSGFYNPKDRFLPKLNFKGKGQIFKLLNKIINKEPIDCYNENRKLSIELLKQQDFDVFHPTYYDDYFLDYIGDKPFVLTIHDMTDEIYPEMAYDVKYSEMKAKLAQQAAHIIAVSENTKKDIIEILGIPESKISVVYHANSLQVDAPFQSGLPEKYLLFVGARSEYKNFMFFVNAVLPLLLEQVDLYIVCTGKEFNNQEELFLKNLGVLDRFILQSADDKELSQLYKNAVALVFPSYYEGFGIPILEAFTMGCPVVLSSSSCFPEIAGGAALYFEAKSVLSVRNAVAQVFDNEIRLRLIQKGYERVSSFKWETSAVQTAGIYERVIN